MEEYMDVLVADFSSLKAGSAQVKGQAVEIEEEDSLILLKSAPTRPVSLIRITPLNAREKGGWQIDSIG